MILTGMGWPVKERAHHRGGCHSGHEPTTLNDDDPPGHPVAATEKGISGTSFQDRELNPDEITLRRRKGITGRGRTARGDRQVGPTRGCEPGRGCRDITQEGAVDGC
jgi:hypothetical protein